MSTAKCLSAPRRSCYDRWINSTGGGSVKVCDPCADRIIDFLRMEEIKLQAKLDEPPAKEARSHPGEYQEWRRMLAHVLEGVQRNLAEFVEKRKVGAS